MMTFMKNSMANMPNNEKVKRKTILDFGILFLKESSLVSPSRLAYLAKELRKSTTKEEMTHSWSPIATALALD